jgi:hypothetical protein
MGLFSRKPQILEAQLAPQVMGENLPSIYSQIALRVSRKEAMSVPSVARARNLICGTVAGIPLEYYNKRTGEKIASPRWVNQLAKNQPSLSAGSWTRSSCMGSVILGLQNAIKRISALLRLSGLLTLALHLQPT